VSPVCFSLLSSSIDSLLAGQLGLGHTNSVEKVSCIKSLKFQDTGEKAILAACGREASIVATDRGAIYAFGSNTSSQLGIESAAIVSQPTKIDQLRGLKWKQLAMGAEHACALTVDGQVYAWGNNEDGQCGQVQKTDVVKVPREMRLEFTTVSM
jgi:alpha-tubulin suppressor-like RCC1 family protein